ncbi:MAG TPA: translation initiation factor IF-2 [Candidatus Avanaerovorax faecigallinarum]|nr:translation initiation factor IF-2 [Candidatus Avanaerovorax faecigallinarum]
MAMKVHELAKEMNLNSKDILERAEKLGISVKSHMSVLSDSDIKKIKEGARPQAAPAASAPRGAGVRPAAPASRPGRRPPIGRPIVDNDYLENKHKKQEEKKAEPAAAEAKKQEPLKAEAPKAEAPEKEAPEAEAPKAAASEKTEAKKETPAKTEVKKESAPTSIPGRQTLKIITKAEDVKAEEEARAAARKAQAAEKAAEKKHNEKTADRNPGRRTDAGTKGPRKGDRPERPARDGRTEGRKGERPDRARGGRDDHGNRRGPAPRREQPAASARDEGRGDHSGRSDRKKQHDKHEKDKGRNKFEKFEKKSLEKQTRKKHVKAKPAQTEPEIEAEPLPEGTIVLNVPITVAGFCEQTEVSTSKVIMTLMKLGIMANINQTIDEDTVMILAEDLGISVAIGKVEEEAVEEGLELFEDREQDLKPRPPIITVMGHVDHGKTSLLDAIRKTNVTASESGGITQHIGASEVRINGQKIVFLDTPGHEAFTAMRARGAHVTDIAVLVVAADDSVKPQTVESISHAKAAGVPIIVAINKMDKPGANPDRVKQDLTEHGILVEDWGGDVISVPVSAKTGDGIVNLLEMILLQAEMMELKANPDRLAMGSVIEARLDKSKGPVATLLVTNGTLHSGQSIVAGTCAGRIRLMTDYKGKTIKKAGPATAVEVLGLTDVPQAGDEFNAVKEDKIAREIAEHRKEKLREEILARNASTTLEQLFSQIQEGEVKELNLIIKGDVQGSVGALVSSLEKLNNENVKVNIIHTGVGTVTESDVMLAGTSGSVIIGFNVRPSTAVQTMADRENIQIRTYRVIYDVIDDVENAMKGMLDPEFREEILGKAEIRNTFKVPGVGIVGGAYVTEGKIVRNADIRLVRDGIVIHEGKISSLKRFKDDAKEVASGYECGIGIENYNDIKEGDVIECFHMVEIERK